MASGSISSPGLGSNLDVAGIVGKLMSLEQQPLLRMNEREGTLLSQISIFGQIKGAISGIQSAAKSLGALFTTATFRAITSDAAILTSSASSAATAGSHSVSVTQLAQEHRIASAGQVSTNTSIGTGGATTLTISFGTISGGTFDSVTGRYAGATFTPNAGKTPFTINLDGTNNTLEGIRDAINAASSGVSASIVSDGSTSPNRLGIRSTDTGEKNSIKLAVSGDATLASLLAYDPSGTQNLTQIQASQDAKLTVDGVAIVGSGNSISGAIAGVTFDLKATGTSTVTVSRDNAQVTSTLGQLVKAYNDATRVISEATKKGAALQGDTGTITLLSRLRSELGALRSGYGEYNSLSQLGVAFQRDGSLAFDSTKLQSALSADFANVTALGSAISASISKTAEDMIGANGSLDARTNGINRSIKAIDSRREALDRRLEQIQARYLAQFNALDTMISSLKQTSTFLDQQLANLPKIDG